MGASGGAQYGLDQCHNLGIRDSRPSSLTLDDMFVFGCIWDCAKGLHMRTFCSDPCEIVLMQRTLRTGQHSHATNYATLKHTRRYGETMN